MPFTKIVITDAIDSKTNAFSHGLDSSGGRAVLVEDVGRSSEFHLKSSFFRLTEFNIFLNSTTHSKSNIDDNNKTNFNNYYGYAVLYTCFLVYFGAISRLWVPPFSSHLIPAK